MGGAGVHQGNNPRTRALGLAVVAAVAWGTLAGAQTTNVASGQILQPVVWQGPEGPQLVAQLLPTGAGATTAPNPLAPGEVPKVVDPSDVFSTQPPIPRQIPPQTITVPVPVAIPESAPPEVRGNVYVPRESPVTQTPLLDGSSPTEDLMPPVVDDSCMGPDGQVHVRPYGGGHATDWSWGCGGSPYRTGPGMCDNWKVGPRWHWTFDGLVMSRDETNPTALIDQMFANNNNGFSGPPQLENFDYGPGGRLTITSQVPRYVGYQIQAAYEGIINWDAAVVFPKTTPVGGAGLDSTQQRSLHYTSDYNSGEINWVTSCDDNWHPYYGVRYIALAERLNDFLDQQAPPPLPGNPPQGPFVTTDVKNLFDIENNLMGFQVGMLHEAWCVTRRCTIEGFASGGVYYNKINYQNKMGTYTTQQIADNTATAATNETQSNISNNVNNDTSDLSEIAYVGEASISGVCRLNKCWALRGGYQVLWIDHVHLADAAFLGNPEQSDSLFMHGWHAGIECRR